MGNFSVFIYLLSYTLTTDFKFPLIFYETILDPVCTSLLMINVSNFRTHKLPKAMISTTVETFSELLSTIIPPNTAGALKILRKVEEYSYNVVLIHINKKPQKYFVCSVFVKLVYDSASV